MVEKEPEKNLSLTRNRTLTLVMTRCNALSIELIKLTVIVVIYSYFEKGCCVDHFPHNLSFRIVVCTFFPTTLLKMAVTYSLWCSKTLNVFIFRLFKAA